MRPSNVGPIQNKKGADAVVRIAPTHQESAGGFPRLMAIRTKIGGIPRLSTIEIQETVSSRLANHQF